MKCVLKELGNYKKELLIIILTTIGTTMATLSLPSLLSVLIDDAYPSKDIMKVVYVGAVMLAIVALGVICGIITSKYSATVSMGVGKNLRSKIFRKVQYFSQTEMDKFSASSLITRTNNDISQVQTFLNQCLRIAIQAPVMCICGII
ncbi:MAG: ABC transporter transmembrane domain-containing protein, partial [Eubacteriales bacterium]|nr:ABC transporter transmembrane domain-containing protein [Eubacteriales bacterium]